MKKTSAFDGWGVKLTVAGAVMVFTVGFIKLPWTKYGDWLLAASSLITGSFLALESQTGSIMLGYTYFILFRIVFQITLTVAR